MRLIFLGSRGAQSVATLKTLLEHDLLPEAVLIEEEGGDPSVSQLALPVIGSSNAPGLPEISAAHGVPASTVSRESLPRVLEALRPDRVLVSCYPYRVPESLLCSVPSGWFNIHPSLLPDYRGPSPVFWQLRDGRDRIGVTLHRMSSELDLGPILAQRTFGLSDGSSMLSLSGQAGRVGALLYLDLDSDAATDTSPVQAQDPAKGSYQSFPRPEDFRIEPEWPALRVFNFIRGVRELGPPFFETESGRRCLIADALSWHDGPGPYPMNETRENARLLRCYNGAVILHIEGYQ